MEKIIDKYIKDIITNISKSHNCYNAQIKLQKQIDNFKYTKKHIIYDEYNNKQNDGHIQ